MGKSRKKLTPSADESATPSGADSAAATHTGALPEESEAPVSRVSAARRYLSVVNLWLNSLNPWLGLIGVLIGLIGVYFYFEGQQKPLLTFAVHPLKIETHRSDLDKEFGFTYRGTPLDVESVTSAKVSLWNAGTRSIRPADVLKPVRLKMPEGVVILNVKVTEASEDTGFNAISDPTDYKRGTCVFNWTILQPGEGAIVQVLYAGTSNQTPSLEGRIAEQKQGIAVVRYMPSGAAVQRFDPMISGARANVILAMMLLAGLVFVCGLVSGSRHQTPPESAKKIRGHLAELWREFRAGQKGLAKVASICFATSILLLLVVIAIAVWWQTSLGPPFPW